MRGPVARRLGVGPDPGVASLSGAPTGDSPRREATLAIASSRADAGFQCRVEPGDWQPCPAPWVVSGLPDGVRRVAVRSVGPEGWVELGDGAQASWRVEAAPPKTTFVSLPDPRSRYAYIRFTADERATFECRWDQGAWRSCSQTDGADANLAEGPHSVEVRATDEVGRREAIPARHDWVIVRFPFAAARAADPPETTITSGPPARTRATSATFTFTSSDPNATFICQTFDTSPAPCTSPHTLPRVYDGHNEFEVTAVAADGTRDQTHAEWVWSVNAEPPDTLLVGTPATREETAYFAWRGNWNDEVVRGDCRLDGGAWFSCTSPLRLPVAYGQHRFEVRSVDVDGEVDPTPVAHDWFADPVTPAVTITAGPSSSEPTTSASLAFTLDRAGATAECRLDCGSY